MLETILAATALALGLFYWVRVTKLQYYSELQDVVERNSVDHFWGGLKLPHPNTNFAARIARLDHVLEPEVFDALVGEVMHLTDTERSFVPSHKKGGTIAYETLCSQAPKVVALYRAPQFQKLVSKIIGTKVVPTPLHDQSSCSVLCYERPGDHIGWHYDHNFYKGRHFTALIPIVNRGRDAGQVSSAELSAWIGDQSVAMPTPPNSLIVFEGARVLHKVTPIEEGELRIILSMTFAEDPACYWYQGIARRIKDTAFFGVRALWT